MRIIDIKRYKYGAIIVMFAIMAVLPLLLNNYALNVLWSALFYMPAFEILIKKK